MRVQNHQDKSIQCGQVEEMVLRTARITPSRNEFVRRDATSICNDAQCEVSNPVIKNHCDISCVLRY